MLITEVTFLGPGLTQLFEDSILNLPNIPCEYFCLLLDEAQNAEEPRLAVEGGVANE